MHIHFTTENFKHDTENVGYIGNPGLVDRNTNFNEIITGIYVDIEGAYVTDFDTFSDTYDYDISYHGYVPLKRNANNYDAMIGILTDSSNAKISIQGYSIMMSGVVDVDNGKPIGKSIKVWVYHS